MEVSQLIKQKVESIEPSAKVVLFGSRARKDHSEHSDWDILVLLNQPKVTIGDEQRIRHGLFEIELENGVAISTFVQSLYNWHNTEAAIPLIQNIKKEGRLL
jgi:predicted nucleotidyltransferase